jgi:hypothetical protein
MIPPVRRRSVSELVSGFWFSLIPMAA